MNKRTNFAMHLHTIDYVLHRTPCHRSGLAVLCIALTALLAACGQSQAPNGPGGPGGMAMPVSALQVNPQRIPVTTEAVGQTEGSRDIEIRARVSGILEKRLYKEGEPVRAGAVLFQIDRMPYEIAMAQAKAALEQEQARSEQAKREAARLKLLVGEKAISQKEYDDSTSTFKQSEATLAAAEAKLHEAELNLSYTAVTAPIGGVSGRALRSEGSLVAAGSDSALLTTVSQTDPIWVRFSFSEAEYLQLRGNAKKAEVKLILADGKMFSTTGKLNFTSSTVDARLGTVQLRAEFANPQLALLPGQFVRAQVLSGDEQAYLVPQSAVMQTDQGRFVWTVGPDGKAAPRPVETGGWSGQNWVVRKGLAPGDKVIVDNLLKLRPGIPVAPHAPGEAPGDATKASEMPKGDTPKAQDADPAAKKAG